MAILPGGGTRFSAVVTLLVLLSILACRPEEEKPLHVTRAVPSPEVVLHEATTVARVRILRREVMKYEGKQAPSPCGYHYYSQVVESLKGESISIDFVSNDVVEPGAEYLLAVADVAGQLPSEVDDPELSKRDRIYLACRMKVPRYALDMLPVEQRRGEPWVVIEGARILPEGVLQQMSGAARWLDVREVIEELLAARDA